jgi:sugar O-acyltransferase (sialic acid O-acetyltransferase NeuD family)
MKTIKKVIGLGAGGHARVAIEALRAADEWTLVGLLDADPAKRGQTFLDLTVLGSDDLMGDMARQGVHHFFLGVGSVGKCALRQRLFEQALANGLTPIVVIHPRAIVSTSARIGKGVCILAGAIINAQAHLGDNVLVNTAAVVEHDCLLGDHVHIATGACLGGMVSVGAGSHVGIGVSVRQGIRIGRNSVVGAGAVVVKDVPDQVVVAGVPARLLGAKSE